MKYDFCQNPRWQHRRFALSGRFLVQICYNLLLTNCVDVIAREGHESLIVESAEQLTLMSVSDPPDVVILSVGGGGLLIGVSQGMDRVGWSEVPILAMETDGAHCFNAAVKANQLVTLPAITR